VSPPAAMTIVAARRYRRGLVVDANLTAASGAARAGEFDWIGLVDPTAEEMAVMQEAYHLHPLAVEDALTPRHPPKAEPYGDSLFVIARTVAPELPEGEKDTLEFGQTAIFLSKRAIITVRLGSPRAHVELRQQLENFPERLAEGSDFVLHAVLDFIVSGYDPALGPLEERVAAMEDGAVTAFPDQERIRRIFRLRRLLRRLEGTMVRMEEMTGKLAQVEQTAIDAAARPYFRDVYDNARRVLGRVRTLLDTLGNILEIAALLEQNRQGVITRQLAAWAAILGVTTAIAGIYGMNFEFMPELRWRYGYFVVVGVTVSVCVGLWLRFRRMGWL
jgi:magnesium transporter